MPARATTSSPAPSAGRDSSLLGKRAHSDDDDAATSQRSSSSPAAKRCRTDSPTETGSKQLPGSPHGRHNSSRPANPTPVPSAAAATESALTPGAAPFSQAKSPAPALLSSSSPMLASPPPPPCPAATASTAGRRARHGEVNNPALPLFAPAVDPTEPDEASLRAHARRCMAAASSRDPNGSPVPPPLIFRRDRYHPRRPVAWIRGWETGAIRPRRMVDDLRTNEGRAGEGLSASQG